MKPDAESIPSVGYFPSDADLDEATGSAHIAESMAPWQTSSGKVAFSVWHFSGDIVCWGRR